MSTATGADIQVTIDNTQINGVVSAQGVRNFLGLPYASVPQRFRQSKLVKIEHLGKHRDARAYGPQCPQPENRNQARRKHLFAGTAPWPPLVASESDCLNLNVYSPPAPSSLPVVVWIHGGGWVYGAGGPEYGEAWHASVGCGSILARR
jgi:carboxylesterase type B